MARRQRRKNTSHRQLIISTLLIVAIIAVIIVPHHIEKEQIHKIADNAKSDITESLEAITKPVVETVKESVQELQELTQEKKSESSITAEKSSPTASTTTAISTHQLELPLLSDSSLLHYDADGRFTTYYDSSNKVPTFVAHILTRAEAEVSEAKRGDKFIEDKHYSRRGVKQATNGDYKNSGYDKGHMVPSADRDDSQKENDATFQFTNIAPQTPTLNRQTINRLEQQTRKWAIEYDSLYIVTGSIITDNSQHPLKSIGDGVTVPQYFYKTILTRHNGEYKAVAFLMPNIKGVDSNFNSYKTTIDEIEKLSKQDLYHKLPDSIENKIESRIDKNF